MMFYVGNNFNCFCFHFNILNFREEHTPPSLCIKEEKDFEGNDVKILLIYESRTKLLINSS